MEGSGPYAQKTVGRGVGSVQFRVHVSSPQVPQNSPNGVIPGTTDRDSASDEVMSFDLTTIRCRIQAAPVMALSSPESTTHDWWWWTIGMDHGRCGQYNRHTQCRIGLDTGQESMDKLEAFPDCTLGSIQEWCRENIVVEYQPSRNRRGNVAQDLGAHVDPWAGHRSQSHRFALPAMKLTWAPT